MCASRTGSTNSREGVRGHGLADRGLHVGDEGELEVDVVPRADVAVAARQVVPLQAVDLPQVVLVEAEALVAGEAPERRLIGVDQVRRVDDAFLFQEPRGVVVGVRRPLEAVELDGQRLELEAVARPFSSLVGRGKLLFARSIDCRVFALAMISS